MSSSPPGVAPARDSEHPLFPASLAPAPRVPSAPPVPALTPRAVKRSSLSPQQAAVLRGSEAVSTTNCAVVPSDLEHLPEIKALLLSLNDAFASGPALEELIRSIPVLSMRVLRSALWKRDDLDRCSLGYALAMIGNRGVEDALMQLLEDLTELKHDLEDGVVKAPKAAKPSLSRFSTSRLRAKRR
ncbi:MAG: hypothetical protein AB7K71_21665 [Polyangiaceae bacterium]